MKNAIILKFNFCINNNNNNNNKSNSNNDNNNNNNNNKQNFVSKYCAPIMHQSIPAVPIPPPPGNHGAFAQMSVPGVGH